MKKIFATAIIIILFLASPLFAAGPWLVCDFQLGVDTYQVDTDGAVVTGISPLVGWVQNGKTLFADPGGIRSQVHVLVDEAALATGSHTQKAKACKNASPPWQPTEVCSDWSDPLAFAKPAPVVVNAPANIRLVQ